MAILEVHNIEKHFGSTRVLEDISFELERGQALELSEDEASITVIATGLDQYGANAPIASVMSGFNNKAKMSQPKPQAQPQPKKTAIEDRPSYTAMESSVPSWKSNVETRSIDVPTFLQRKR